MIRGTNILGALCKITGSPIETPLRSEARTPWRRLVGLSALALANGGVALTPTFGFAQNLIQNPGFEPPACVAFTTTCPGWVFSGSANVANNFQHSGTQSGGVDFTPTPGSIQQTVTLSKAGIYNFSFFYSAEIAPAILPGSNTLSATASIGGQTVLNQTFNSIFINAQSSTSVRLSAGTTDIAFSGSGSGDGCCFYIDDVSLTLLQTLGLVSQLPPGASTNVVNVAGAIDNFTNNGGTPPTSLSNLFNLSGTQLQTALMQLDGEASTDAEKGAFALMNQFMGLMLDPFADGRFGPSGGPIGFAPDQQASFPPDIALAYASVLKAPPVQSFNQRWTAWGSGFGASSTTSGNAAIGSNNITAADYGFAGGMDYHFTPNALAGFALAGGGTNWGLAQGLGTGRSDAFQAGVYGKSYWGLAYVAAALAFTNNWFTTNRTALGDDLTANFAGQSYGGRLETGYRYTLPVGGGVIGATPYAAIQTQWFHTPTYSETDLAGGGLGLTYNAMTANDTRSELGARFDDPTLLNGMPLILRARFAWAHDWVSNPSLDAAFQSLPGSSFIVNGATPPKNSALASAGAQYFLSPAWSFTAKFDGEFASGSQTYGGTGTLRYTW